MRLLLARQPDVAIVGEAADGIEAVEMVNVHRPDLVLIDARLPRMDGFEATRIITGKHPKIKVILLTLLTDDGTRVKALEAGACHCLSKESPLNGMLAVIRAAALPH